MKQHNMRPWHLLETNYAHTKQAHYEVAVLPLGATEPHNLHLPYGTDLLEGTIIGEQICEEAHARGAQVVLLPTIPFGAEANMKQLPLAINLNPSTLNRVVRDVIDSLLASGIRKIVLLNSHGGNELKPLLREMIGSTEAQLFLCNWYQMVGDVYHDIFDEAEDHAGEMETSLGLAFFPELVARDAAGMLLADEGATRPMRFEALEKKWVSISRPWHLLTTNSGSGNPHAASKEKGERLMQLLVDRLAGFLVDLSQAEIDESFPF
jgi:creatinine amidohydrolase